MINKGGSAIVVKDKLRDDIAHLPKYCTGTKYCRKWQQNNK